MMKHLKSHIPLKEGKEAEATKAAAAAKAVEKAAAKAAEATSKAAEATSKAAAKAAEKLTPIPLPQYACGKRLNSVDGLFVHLSAHERWTHVCKLCSYTFGTSSQKAAMTKIKSLGVTPEWVANRLKSNPPILDPAGRLFKERLDNHPESVFYMDTEGMFQNEHGILFEIALLDHKGNPLVDTVVDHGLSVADLYRWTRRNVKQKDIGLRSVAKIYGAGTEEQTPGMTYEDIADEILGNVNLTQDCQILEWSTNRCDWKSLQRLVTAVDPSTTIRTRRAEFDVTYAWKLWWESQGLRYYRLDVLHPLCCPDSEFVGQNHRAAPDAQMVREMVELYFVHAQ
ncbi:hypothetical protein MMC16_003089 [Acarospora aff. strigata]|nr:hypothetical protein [Acarospora aff. strigata]